MSTSSHAPTTARLALFALVLATGCVSDRTIPTRAHPEGETIPCIGIGIDKKREHAGVDFEVVAPPIIVAIHETFCPVADTSSAKAKP